MTLDIIFTVFAFVMTTINLCIIALAPRHKPKQHFDKFKTVIIPKYQIGQIVWYIGYNDQIICSFAIESIEIFLSKNNELSICYYNSRKSLRESRLFATMEEAEKEVVKRRGGNECPQC